MTEEEAREKVRPILDGKTLNEIEKTRIEEKSCYNDNYYLLKDGIEIYVHTDEFTEDDTIYLVDGKVKIYVGCCTCFSFIDITDCYPS